MEISKKLKNIRMLVCDVDGVMTDGRIWLSDQDKWVRQFNVRDGVGIKQLLKHNFLVAAISGGDSNDVRKRLEFLKVPFCYFGIEDKSIAFEDLLNKTNLEPHQCAYIGDDIYDLPILNKVGVGFTVPNAIDEILDSEIIVTKRSGGFGAVREVCDLILRYAQRS